MSPRGHTLNDYYCNLPRVKARPGWTATAIGLISRRHMTDTKVVRTLRVIKGRDENGGG